MVVKYHKPKNYPIKIPHTLILKTFRPSQYKPTKIFFQTLKRRFFIFSQKKMA